VTTAPDVLHLSWEYPPVVHGGLGRHVGALARAQAAAGSRVAVVASAEDVAGRVGRPVVPGAAADEVADGVHLRWARRDPAVPWTRPAEAAEALAAAMESAAAPLHRPRVLHAHDWMTAPAGMRLRGRWRVPLVLTVHATEHGRREGRLDSALPAAVHAAERAAVAAADAVIVCSPAMCAEVVTVLGADPGRVHVVPGGVDADRWLPPGGPRDPDLLVAAGRLEWEKGFSTLLRALPAVLRDRPGTRLVLAGDGSYAPVLRELAGSLGVGAAVRFAGWQDEAGLAALYGRAAAVVVPSRYEPFGLVALEAQACGAPVVTTGAGGLDAAVRDGVTGRRFAVGDVHRLGALLTAVLADPEGSRELARRGRESALARTWEEAADGSAQAYCSVTPVDGCTLNT